jgi:4-hydroxybenzoate polyprenyltransferase
MKHYISFINERFPLFQTLPLAGFFGFAIAVPVAYVTGNNYSLWSFLFVSGALWLFLLQLRLFDDVKDASHDASFHKDRPIPKGLISSNDLFKVALPLLALEFVIAYIAGYTSLLVFFIVTLYSLALLWEGITYDALRKKFVFYIFLHELLLVPLLLYLFLLTGAKLFDILQPTLMYLFVAYIALFFLIEISRKVKNKGEESGGKDSYTEQFGIVGATTLLFVTGFIAGISIIVGALPVVDPSYMMIFILTVFFLIAGLCLSGYLFVKKPTSIRAKMLFGYSILFTATTLSLIPLALLFL